jgi:hypothetical protein
MAVLAKWQTALWRQAAFLAGTRIEKIDAGKISQGCNSIQARNLFMRDSGQAITGFRKTNVFWRGSFLRSQHIFCHVEKFLH